MSDLTFREKSILGTLVATLAVTAAYAAHAAPLLVEGAALGRFLWPAVPAVIAMIAVQIVYHSLLAATDVEVPADERDAMVDLRATRWAYWTLSAGCLLVLLALINCTIFDSTLGTALLVHLLALVLTVADVSKYTAQLIGYRRLA